jgi:DNA-binding CsgD family transcriptional regulator
MLRGVWYLTTFRPVPESGTAGGPAGLTLEIIRPAPLPEPGEEASAITHGHDGYQLLKHHDLGPLGTLTTKELLILRLIGLGFTTANIAKEIDRSVKTIEWYRVSLGEKFNVANRVELAGVAIRAGLVYLDEKTVASLRAAEDRDPGVRVHALRKRTGPPARRGRKPKSAE